MQVEVPPLPTWQAVDAVRLRSRARRLRVAFQPEDGEGGARRAEPDHVEVAGAHRRQQRLSHVRLLHVVEVAADLDVDLSDRDVELGAPIIERADSWLARENV